MVKASVFFASARRSRSSKGKAPDAAVVPHRRGGDSDDLTMAGGQKCGISMAGWWMFIPMVSS